MSRRRDKKNNAHQKSRPRKVSDRAVTADLSQQVPNNSYGLPKTFYFDIEFNCRDCGRLQIWTGEEQKWYYEIAKGPLYATAIRCRACRDRIKEEKDIQRQQMRDSKKSKGEN